MFGEHHSLVNEFPELKERMHELKANDARFASLFDEYHEVDREVYRIEEHIESRSDQYTEDLKKKRALLKDQLYAMLKA